MNAPAFTLRATIAGCPCRSTPFTRALAAAFSELADEVFVAFADDVGFDVLQSEAFGADGLDEVREAVIVEDIAEALRENEGQDVVLVFRRVLGSADGAGGVPDP